MMKSIATSIILCCALSSASSAATTQDLNLTANQWIVLEFNNTNSIDFVVAPTSVDGSFTFASAYSLDGCGPSGGAWSCMPTDLETNAVHTGGNSNFSNGWGDITYYPSITDSFPISFLSEGAEKFFVFFRATSGNGTFSQIGDDVAPPAPVPLPAAGLMLFAGLASVGGLGVLKRQRSKTKA